MSGQRAVLTGMDGNTPAEAEPHGFRYRNGIVSEDEEARLVAELGRLDQSSELLICPRSRGNFSAASRASQVATRTRFVRLESTNTGLALRLGGTRTSRSSESLSESD